MFIFLGGFQFYALPATGAAYVRGLPQSLIRNGNEKCVLLKGNSPGKRARENGNLNEMNDVLFLRLENGSIRL